MREIVLDTETTGLDPLRGDRLVEVGCIELFNRMPTGQTFHRYMNPERVMPAEAFAVHGLSTEFLASKPLFSEVVEEFLAFIGDAPLVIHNASFDVPRLDRHLGLRVAPVHDKMLAARRGGERHYSLKAQAEKHLGLALDKAERQSDWGARPLDPRQVAYAALDAAATLLLYEHQVGRGLRAEYRPRARAEEAQAGLSVKLRQQVVQVALARSTGHAVSPLIIALAHGSSETPRSACLSVDTRR